MSTHLYDHGVPRPRSRAAWLASLVVHATMLLALGYISWATLGGVPRRHDATETSVVLGLGDSAGDDALKADTPKDDDARKALALDASQPEGPSGDGIATDPAMAPIPTGEKSADPLTPAPQLSMVALAGGASAPSSDAAPTGISKESGSPNVSQQLAQLQERAKVTVFGAVGEGHRFVYLFDRSTSMDGAPLLAAKEQLIASLDALKPVHQFQVIFFNHEVQVWDLTGGQRRIPYASDANKRLAAQFVETVVASGGTERWRPLNAALAMSPDVIFFLTDADDGMGDRDISDIVTRAERQGTKIACIEYGEGPAKEHTNFLWEIASRTRADYVYVDTSALFKH